MKAKGHKYKEILYVKGRIMLAKYHDINDLDINDDSRQIDNTES